MEKHAFRRLICHSLPCDFTLWLLSIRVQTVWCSEKVATAWDFSPALHQLHPPGSQCSRVMSRAHCRPALQSPCDGRLFLSTVLPSSHLPNPFLLKDVRKIKNEAGNSVSAGRQKPETKTRPHNCQIYTPVTGRLRQNLEFKTGLDYKKKPGHRQEGEWTGWSYDS